MDRGKAATNPKCSQEEHTNGNAEKIGRDVVVPCVFAGLPAGPGGGRRERNPAGTPAGEVAGGYATPEDPPDPGGEAGDTPDTAGGDEAPAPTADGVPDTAASDAAAPAPTEEAASPVARGGVALAASEYFTVTVNGQPTAGGGYAAGSAVTIGSTAAFPYSEIKLTTDGSDPSQTLNVSLPQTFSLNGFVHLRVGYLDGNGVYQDSGIDYLFTPTDTHYRNIPGSLAEGNPGLYEPTPEITDNTYRFDGTDPGIADTRYTAPGEGWDVLGYSAGFLPPTAMINKRSGDSLLVYRPPGDGRQTATAKTTRQMLMGSSELNTGLSFWLWQDTFYHEDEGVAFTLYGPGGEAQKIPLFYSARGTTGWKQYFIDLHDYLKQDAHGAERLGFSIEGRGNNPLLVDDVGVVLMERARVETAWPESMAQDQIFIGESVVLSDSSGFVSTSAIANSQGETLFDDTFGGIPATGSKSYTGEAEQTLIMRPGVTNRGAVSTLQVPRLSARQPRLYVNGGEVDSNPGGLWELKIGDAITLQTDDHTYTTPDANGQVGDDVALYYTLDGSPVLDANDRPVPGAMQYTSPILYSGGYMHLRVAAAKPFPTLEGNTSYWQSSYEQEWRFDLPRAAAVAASPAAGTVEPGTSVSLSCATPNAKIYYSTDGTTPTRARPGTLYTGPLTIGADTVLTAVAWTDGYSESNAATFHYTMPEGGDIFEPNNGFAAASPVSFPFQIDATLHRAADVDYYAFDFPGGRLEARLAQPKTGQAQTHPYEMALMDADGQAVAASEGYPDHLIGKTLAAGRYYLVVKGPAGAPAAAFGAGPYTLSASRLAVEGLDFSEMNLVTAMNHPDAPAAYTMGEGLHSGGTQEMSLAYLARWSGPVLEEQDPYTVVKKGDPNDPDSEVFDNDAMPYHAIAPQYHLSEGMQVATPNVTGSAESVKQALYTHGALHISYDNVFEGMPGYRKEYYYPPELAGQLNEGGHAVTLVGWDDDYPASQLAVEIGGTLYTPAGDGAWIFKNSWGDDGVGEDGYFYASYYSKGFLDTAAYYRLESELNYNAVYQYDLLGVTGTKPLLGEENQNYVYMKNTFTAEAGETLRAVGFYTTDQRQRYDVYIEQNGERQQVAGGLMAERGYHTLRLAQDVPLTAGRDFAVIVRLESTGDAPIQVPGEYKNPGQSDKVVLQTGKTFLSVDGQQWTDMTLPPYEGNACVKAFAHNSRILAGGIAYHGADMPDISGTLPDRPPLVDDPTTHADNTGLGANESPLADIPQSSFPSPSLSLPAAFDLREVGAVTPVKNQGSLGSCWTFATYGSAESVFMRNNNIAYAYPSSVSLERSSATVDLAGGEQMFSLAATVSAPDAIGTNLVYWSVSGDVDAVQVQNYISESGRPAELVRAVGTGRVRLTATSAADTTKSASMELTITDSRSIPGLEGLGLVTLPTMTPTDGRMSAEQLQAVLDALQTIEPGQALVLRFTGETLIPKAVFEALRARGVKLALVLVDAGGATLYNVVFDGQSVTAPADYLLGYRLEGSKLANELARTAFDPGSRTQPLTHSHSGALPGPAVVSIPQRLTPFTGERGELLYYRFDGAFSQERGVSAKLENAYVRLDNVVRCSEYRLVQRGARANPGDATSPGIPLAIGAFSAILFAALLAYRRRPARARK